MKLSIDEPAGDHGLLNDAHARQGPAGCHEVCKTDATESDGAQRGAFGVFVRKYAIFGDPAIRERMRKTLQARGLDTPIETLMSIFQRIVL
jgi:hypothetical protein